MFNRTTSSVNQTSCHGVKKRLLIRNVQQTNSPFRVPNCCKRMGEFYCVSIDSPSFVIQHLNGNTPSQNFTVTLPAGTVSEALTQSDSNFPGVGFCVNIQGGSNMTGTDLCVNKPHCAAAVRP